MAETQSTNLKLDLVDGDSLFDTGKVKSNFEKIDTAVGSLTENMDNKNFIKDSEQSIAGQFSSSRVSHIGWDDASGRLVIKIDGAQVRYVTVSKS